MGDENRRSRNHPWKSGLNYVGIIGLPNVKDGRLTGTVVREIRRNVDRFLRHIKYDPEGELPQHRDEDEVSDKDMYYKDFRLFRKF